MRFLWLVSGRHQCAQKEGAPQDFVLLTSPSSIQTPRAVKNRSISGHHCPAMSPAALGIKTSTLKPCKPCSHPTGREILENPNGTIVSLGKERLSSHTTDSLKAWLFLKPRQEKANYDLRRFNNAVTFGLPPVTHDPWISSPTPCLSQNQEV